MANFNGRFKVLEKVGTSPSGRSPFGAHDMAGNASEWCLDGFATDFLEKLLEKYPKDRKSWAVNPFNEGDPLGPHAVRGGNWDDGGEELLVTRRSGSNEANDKIGFRCTVWHVKRD
jgi:formylglycine-generating enzyme required for sulfatase activity